jgi:hypothetical protein
MPEIWGTVLILWIDIENIDVVKLAYQSTPVFQGPVKSSHCRIAPNVGEPMMYGFPAGQVNIRRM